MEQNYSRTVTGRQIMQPEPIDFGSFGGDAIRSFGSLRVRDECGYERQKEKDEHQATEAGIDTGARTGSFVSWLTKCVSTIHSLLLQVQALPTSSAIKMIENRNVHC